MFSCLSLGRPSRAGSRTPRAAQRQRKHLILHVLLLRARRQANQRLRRTIQTRLQQRHENLHEAGLVQRKDSQDALQEIQRNTLFALSAEPVQRYCRLVISNTGFGH